MHRILFVCHGNICRSPMAEYLFKDLAAKAGRAADFCVASAATSSEELGNPVYPPARRELARHGIGCAGHTARRLTRADYDRWDLLIGMDRANLRSMQRLFDGDPLGKCSLLPQHERPPRIGISAEVDDPWYSGDFSAAWRDIYAGCTGLLAELADRDKKPAKKP